MKEIFAVIAVLVSTLGIAGISFSAEIGTLAMKHDDVKICGNINCCSTQEKTKETVSTKKSEASDWWSLNFYEALQRMGVDLPSDR